MKALAVDTAVTRFTVAARNEDKQCVASYEIGMRQSECLVDAADYVLAAAGLRPSELDYTALAMGPGSFTGLRLGISAVKAIQLAYGVPVYAIPTLEVYAHPFSCFDLPVLSVIDAHKERFYAGITCGTERLLEDGDWEEEKILAAAAPLQSLLVAGPAALLFKEKISAAFPAMKVLAPLQQAAPAEILLDLAEQKIKEGRAPLADYDGPLYLRASEAEVKREA